MSETDVLGGAGAGAALPPGVHSPAVGFISNTSLPVVEPPLPVELLLLRETMLSLHEFYNIIKERRMGRDRRSFEEEELLDLALGTYGTILLARAK